MGALMGGNVEHTTPPHHPTGPLDARVSALEVWRYSQERDAAVLEERRRSEAVEFERVNRRLDKIEQLISRLVWLIMVAIVGAFMTFVINGGLANAGS